MVPNLGWFHLVIFQHYHGVKAICIQWKLYVRLWIYFSWATKLLCDTLSWCWATAVSGNSQSAMEFSGNIFPRFFLICTFYIWGINSWKIFEHIHYRGVCLLLFVFIYSKTISVSSRVIYVYITSSTLCVVNVPQVSDGHKLAVYKNKQYKKNNKNIGI